MVTSTLATTLAETTEPLRELPVDPMWFGIGAIVVFAALLAFTFAFRSVGKRH
jgi:hypothetical protein